MGIFRLIVFVVFTFFSCFSEASAESFCLKLIPSDLVLKISQDFPSHLVPSLNDLDPESVAWEKEHGSNGCYAVAKGKFGGASVGYAILLKSRNDKVPILVAALKKGRYWKLFRLDPFCDDIRYCYVKPEKTGKYTRSAALDGPLNSSDERMVIRSKNASIRVGVIESTGVVYVLTNGRWNYVWVSD